MRAVKIAVLQLALIMLMVLPARALDVEACFPEQFKGGFRQASLGQTDFQCFFFF